MLVGATSPGIQFDVTRTAVKPASRSCAIFALAVTRSGGADDVLRRAERHRRTGALRGSASARQTVAEPRSVRKARRKVGVR